MFFCEIGHIIGLENIAYAWRVSPYSVKSIALTSIVVTERANTIKNGGGGLI